MAEDMITQQEFEDLAQSYNVIPLVRTMLADMHTPVSTYLMLREERVASFLFESVEPNEKIGRYSFVGIEPGFLISAKGESVEIQAGNARQEITGKIFDVLRDVSQKYKQAPVDSAHTLKGAGEDGVFMNNGFTGGFVGYVGYDCVGQLENVPLRKAHADDSPDALLGLFQTVVCFDHVRQLLTVIHNVILDQQKPLHAQYEAGRKKLDAMMLRLRKSPVVSSSFVCNPPEDHNGSDAVSYAAAVRRAKEYITEGDIFQVVLSRRLQIPFSGDPFPVYRALRIINPSPYLFYLDFGEIKLIGSSPEVLVRANQRVVELLPIAGTRKRGLTEEEDLRLEEELLEDEKELAEHIMLVDLGRNDVGRISEFGSVHVPVFKKVVRYSHVMHIVSEVRGTLARGATGLDALRACFPAGTVSGAPKVRAMEIINELEPVRRGIYAGAVGYLGFDGTLDTCIAIRTIVAYRDMLSIQAGAGIVADSVPEREYMETSNKAQALLDAIALAPKLSTLGADGATSAGISTRESARV
jgi:anthranilate synthase component 1